MLLISPVRFVITIDNWHEKQSRAVRARFLLRQSTQQFVSCGCLSSLRIGPWPTIGSKIRGRAADFYIYFIEFLPEQSVPDPRVVKSGGYVPVGKSENEFRKGCSLNAINVVGR
jgi:hypothetical protein